MRHASRDREPGDSAPVHEREADVASAPEHVLFILGLQQTVGNAQVARLLAGRAPGGMLQRTWLNPFHTAPVDEEGLTDEEKIEKTAGSSGNDVVALYHYQAGRLVGKATVTQRIKMLNLLHGERWVGPEAEYAMEFIWNSFGTALPGIAKDNAKLWKDCIEDGAELHKIDAVKGLRQNFERDVKAIADRHMDANLTAARTEMERLGLRAPEGETSPTRELEIELRRKEVADLMARVAQAQAAQAALRRLPVGYGGPMSATDGVVPDEGTNVWEESDAEGVTTHKVAHETAYFDPEHPPMHEPRGTEKPPFFKYQDVKNMWVTTQAYIDTTSAQSPAVFAAVAQDKVSDAAGAPTPQQALQAVGDVLRKLESNISETKGKIGSGEIDYRSLAPIHQQMYSGQQAGPSGTHWDDQLVATSVARGVVEDEEAWTMWKSLIVGLLAAGAFIAAEFFTAGLATPALMGIGAGLSIGQAAVSWQQYVNLATASQSAAGPQTQVVTPEQAESALWQALFDTVFAVLDVAAPAWKAGKVLLLERQVGRALEKTAVSQVTRVAELIAKGDTQEASRIVRAVVNEFGVQGAIERTGKSGEELAKLFQGDAAMLERLQGASRFGVGKAGVQTAEEAAAAEAARRSARAGLAAEGTAARAFLESGPLDQLLPKLVEKLNQDVITRQMADELVLEAVERFGPKRTIEMSGGWKRLSTALTNESKAAQPFISWRNAIYQDMKEFAERELGAPIPDQGSSGAFKNDLDISFMGEHGAENRAKMRAFVAARAGIADSPEALNHILMMELFTDPRRLRAYDALPDAIREKLAREQTAYERELIPNRDLYQARKAGDEELERAILEQMRRDGVHEFPYHPLSSGEIERLARGLDSAHTDLLAAVERGDVPAQEAAARRLGQTQALMNAAEEGGYYSGGSAKRYVTNRDPANPMDPLVAGRGAAPLATEDVGAMIDQMSKLSHAAQELGHASLRDDLVDALRAIGKYGGRAAEVAGGRGAAEAEWAALADACKELKRAADGKLAANLLRQAPDLTEAMARQLLGQVKEASMQALERIRAAAGPLGPGNAQLINQAIRNHVMMLRSLDYAQYFIGAMARAVRTGTLLIMDDSMRPPSTTSSGVGDFGPPDEGRAPPGRPAPAAAVPA